MKKDKLLWVIPVLFSLLFFYKTIVSGLLPIPADALVGLYHPYRDYFSNRFPQGVPYKNFILTDPVLQQYPWKWLAISSKNNPYTFGGRAAGSVENIQAGAFYPLNVVFFIINNFSSAWTVFVMIQPIMAAVIMFWWLRKKGISILSSIFGGIVWAFSSFNLVWMEWGNIGHAGLWLPLSMLCVDKIRNQKSEIRKSLKWHALLQFSLMSSLLAGHWQISLYLLAAVALYWFIRMNISKRSIFLFFISYFLFLIFTSIQWLPAWRFMSVSNRRVEQENVLSREGFFIKPKQLIQLVVPDFFGNPATGNYRGEWNYSEQIIYVGMIPLMLALFSVFSLKDSPSVRKDCPYEKARLYALLLVAGGLLMAVKNPIAELPYRLNIPILSDLQPTRLSYLITFGLVVLAAIGLQNLTIKFEAVSKKLCGVWGGLGTGFLGLLILSSKFDLVDKIVSQRNLVWQVMIWGLFGAGYLVMTFVKFNGKKSFTVLFSVFCFLFSVIDLFRFGWKFTPFSPPEYLYPVTPAIKFLQENLGEGERYMTLDRRILPPNANIMYRLESIEGYDPIYSKDYAELVTKMETGDSQDEPANFGRIVRPGNFGSPTAKELGVRYVLALNEIEDKKLAKVFQEGETRIYEFVKWD